ASRDQAMRPGTQVKISAWPVPGYASPKPRGSSRFQPTPDQVLPPAFRPRPRRARQPFPLYAFVPISYGDESATELRRHAPQNIAPAQVRRAEVRGTSTVA